MKTTTINTGLKLNLKEGTYTYVQLMELTGWCYNTLPATRAKQLLELQRHCLIQKVGKGRATRYHIIKVYDTPTTQDVFYRPNRELYSNLAQVLIPRELLKYGEMIVYKVQFGNQVYIGSTFDIMTRLSQHFNNHVNEHTYHMLKRGGTFEMLEHITTTEEDLRAREIEYIKEYKACGVFTVINNQHAKGE